MLLEFLERLLTEILKIQLETNLGPALVSIFENKEWTATHSDLLEKLQKGGLSDYEKRILAKKLSDHFSGVYPVK